MKTTKYLLLAAAAGAAVWYLRSEKSKDLRNAVADRAKHLKKKMTRLGGDAADRLSELKDVMSTEMEGLSADTRKRVESLLNGTSKQANKFKNNIGHQLS